MPPIHNASFRGPPALVSRVSVATIYGSRPGGVLRVSREFRGVCPRKYFGNAGPEAETMKEWRGGQFLVVLVGSSRRRALASENPRAGGSRSGETWPRPGADVRYGWTMDVP